MQSIIYFSHLMQDAISTRYIADIYGELLQYDVILIDEAQFVCFTPVMSCVAIFHSDATFAEKKKDEGQFNFTVEPGEEDKQRDFVVQKNDMILLWAHFFNSLVWVW